MFYSYEWVFINLYRFRVLFVKLIFLTLNPKVGEDLKGLGFGVFFFLHLYITIRGRGILDQKVNNLIN